MPIRAVLFDFTSTLVDLAEDVGSVYARIASRHGVTVPGPRLGEAFGHAVRRAPPRFRPGLSATQLASYERDWWRAVVRQSFNDAAGGAHFAAFDAFFSELFAFYERREAWSLRPGAHPTLRAITASGRLAGVVSNFDHRLPNILQELEIDHFFDVVMLPARCGSAKPEHAIFAAALETLRLPAGAALYVGHDPVLDLEAASRAGLATCDVRALADLTDLLGRLDAPATLLPSDPVAGAASGGRQEGRAIPAAQERKADD